MSQLQAIKQRFGIIGTSDLLHRALDTAIRVANTDLTVLIQGESGVGKEVFSKIIHSLSSRKHNTFIAINCGAIPEGTINSELFGHEKGSFTGASNDRKGYFETANQGTIFLDEIGEMPLDTQAYLLRVLESGEFHKVGASTEMKTDVRIIAATNVSLIDKIQAGKFREDLYYRLNIVPIKVPSLAERREDIFMLFRKFAIDFADKYRTDPIKTDDRARIVLENYRWPGNIRELKNVVEQLSILSQEKNVTAEILVDLIPNILQRNLPSITKQGENEFLQEREILYKLLFEMKADLNDLKSLVFELVKTNDLNMPDQRSMKSIEPPKFNYARSMTPDTHHATDSTELQGLNQTALDNYAPLILHSNQQEQYETTEVVEENLSIEDMEKEMIKKALKKYRNRRKEAADELGISERTLYRKIKQYDI